MPDRTDDAIDPDGFKPIYVQVADIFERRIRSGKLRPDRRIPGELAIAAEFGIARETARRAVAELRERGLVATWHGRGTFVVAELPPPADAEAE
ncbi:MAG TPA: GntR family transcriptional regulator [Streptosporangiaceae bacterium]|jgi:DNA-binding GntR family transcriptional regulator